MLCNNPTKIRKCWICFVSNSFVFKLLMGLRSPVVGAGVSISSLGSKNSNLEYKLFFYVYRALLLSVILLCKVYLEDIELIELIF
jgi:hypothetical protein